MADLTTDDVLKLAKLARIDLSDEELPTFVREFNAILEYVQQLQDVDVSGLEPTSQVTGLTNITRPDEVKSYGYDPLKLLENVPKTENNLIKVNRMIA